MKANKQAKISVPKSGFKRSRFNWSHDVNTTFSWGEIQPTQCKLLIPGSKTTMSTQSLIRLAPMVAPTFGRVKYKTYNQFVSLAEIMPNFDAMMAQEPKSTGYGTRVPASIPYVKLGPLTANILYGARATLYFADNATAASRGEYWTQYRTAPNIVPNASDPTCSDWYTAAAHIISATGPIYNAPQTDALNNAANAVMPNISGMMLNLGLFGVAYGNVYGNTDYQVCLGAQHMEDFCPVRKDYTAGAPATSPLSLKDYQREVTFESADYVLEGSYEYSAGNVQYFALAVELSDFGKRLRKVFQGVGYQIDFQSNLDVSILPLLAQYKAYFDIFGLELYQGWETTCAAKLIKDIENRFLTNMTSSFVRSSQGALVTVDNSNMGLAFIMIELANEWYTDDADYVSAHIAKLGVSPSPSGIGAAGSFIDVDNNGIQTTLNLSTTANDAVTDATTLIDATQMDNGLALGVNAGNVGGIMFTNKIQHTQIDAEMLKRLYKWVNRNTILGRRIAEILRAQGLGKYVDECKSNYIGSTDTMITISDVVSTAATEDASLGEFGGKGLQYDATGTLTFENDSYGYWITLATVVPEAGYTQGLDPTLTSLDKFNLYNPDFDAVGMELTPKSNIIGNQFICDPTVGSQNYNGFGFIPRYSKFKVCNNLTNGDFNRHGKRNTYLPYTLDKQLNVNDYSVDAESYKFTNLTSKIWNYVKLDKSVKANNMPIAGNVWRQPTKFNWLGNFDRIFLNVGQHDDYDAAAVNPGDAIGFTDYNDDNFLGHHIYEVHCYAPMKPIEDSYGLDDMDDPNGKAGREVTSKA